VSDAIVQGIPVGFWRIDPGSAARELNVAKVLAPGGKVGALQMLLSDPAGRLPWDRRCEASNRSVQAGLFAIDWAQGSGLH
jgi:hypothetical protein